MIPSKFDCFKTFVSCCYCCYDFLLLLWLLLLLLLLLCFCCTAILLLSFSSVLSILFCVSKVGLTTKVTSFSSLHGDVVDHGGGGIVEISNHHRVPSIYYSRLLLGKVLLQRLLLELLLQVLAMLLVNLPCQVDPALWLLVFFFWLYLVGEWGVLDVERSNLWVLRELFWRWQLWHPYNSIWWCRSCHFYHPGGQRCRGRCGESSDASSRTLSLLESLSRPLKIHTWHIPDQNWFHRTQELNYLSRWHNFSQGSTRRLPSLLCMPR